MPYLEWDDDDLPILNQTDDTLDASDDRDDDESELYSQIALREAAVQSALEFHAAQLEEGTISLERVIQTADRFVTYLRSGL